MCIHRTPAPGPLLWHPHKLLCPLVKQLSSMIAFTVTRSRPRTHKIATLAPGGHLTKPKRHPSAGIRMCRSTSLRAFLTAKAKLLPRAWQQGGDARGCLGSMLPKTKYVAPARDLALGDVGNGTGNRSMSHRDQRGIILRVSCF